jgi:hypothetical protein
MKIASGEWGKRTILIFGGGESAMMPVLKMSVGDEIN